MAKSIYHHERQVSRAELVAELHRVAAELESRRQLVFGEGELSEHLDAPDTLEWAVDIRRTNDGAVVELHIEVELAASDSQSAPASSGRPSTAAPIRSARAPSARPGPL